MTTVSEEYQKRLDKGYIQPDPVQIAVVAKLQPVYDALVNNKKSFFGSRSLVKGLYLWGKVGRGKTYLMDLFYEALPFTDKMRSHFHRFMRDVHESLQKLEGKKNPLKILAKEYAAKTRVLCFDEFVVDDIADAMVLGNLLEALFEEGVCLVATSNVEPDKLYWHGLQREQFIPAIKLIEKNTAVFEMAAPTDYRRHHLANVGVYYTPLGEKALHDMKQEFLNLSAEPRESSKILTIDGRSIPAVQTGKGAVWFDFEDICNVPRSQRDYLILSDMYDSIFVSDVKQLQVHQDDLTRNFINMVDVFYDARKKLILSAAVPIEQLYPAGRYAFEFKRTISRLIEMQSLAYLQDYNQL